MIYTPHEAVTSLPRYSKRPIPAKMVLEDRTVDFVLSIMRDWNTMPHIAHQEDFKTLMSAIRWDLITHYGLTMEDFRVEKPAFHF